MSQSGLMVNWKYLYMHYHLRPTVIGSHFYMCIFLKDLFLWQSLSVMTRTRSHCSMYVCESCVFIVNQWYFWNVQLKLLKQRTISYSFLLYVFVCYPSYNLNMRECMNNTIPLLVPALFCVLVKVSPWYCDFKVYSFSFFFTVVSNNAQKKGWVLIRVCIIKICITYRKFSPIVSCTSCYFVRPVLTFKKKKKKMQKREREREWVCMQCT